MSLTGLSDKPYQKLQTVPLYRSAYYYYYYYYCCYYYYCTTTTTTTTILPLLVSYLCSACACVAWQIRDHMTHVANHKSHVLQCFHYFNASFRLSS